MKTDTADGDALGTADEPSVSTIFDVLSARYRRYVLYYLGQQVGAVTVPELAGQLARWEDATEPGWVERIATGLHHSHLPKLAAADAVRYDPESETVRRASAADAFDPYLDLAMRAGPLA